MQLNPNSVGAKTEGVVSIFYENVYIYEMDGRSRGDARSFRSNDRGGGRGSRDYDDRRGGRDSRDYGNSRSSYRAYSDRSSGGLNFFHIKFYFRD